MPRKRCVIQDDGTVIADESAEANNEAVAENAAIAKVQSKVDWDDYDEADPVELYCE